MTTAQYRPVPALTSFVALIERPLHGGADRVLRVEPATEREALLREALALNCPGLKEGYTVEDCAPLVLRQAGTQYRARFFKELAVYMSESAAALARERMEAETGAELVIEPLAPAMLDYYKAWRVMG